MILYKQKLKTSATAERFGASKFWSAWRKNMLKQNSVACTNAFGRLLVKFRQLSWKFIVNELWILYIVENLIMAQCKYGYPRIVITITHWTLILEIKFMYISNQRQSFDVITVPQPLYITNRQSIFFSSRYQVQLTGFEFPTISMASHTRTGSDTAMVIDIY